MSPREPESPKSPDSPAAVRETGRPADRRSAARRVWDGAARASLRVGFRLLQIWWRFRHPTLEGVYVAVWHDGRVLVIKNSYQTAFSFPSGRRGQNEAPERAAARELREEVGIDVAPERLVHVGEFLTETRLVTDHIHFYELQLAREPHLAIDHREVVWAGFESPARARERPLLISVARYLAGRSTTDSEAS